MTVIQNFMALNSHGSVWSLPRLSRQGQELFLKRVADYVVLIQSPRRLH